MEIAVIAVVLIVFIAIALVKPPRSRSSHEDPSYRDVTIPCDENQRVLLLSCLESHGIAYREIPGNSYNRYLLNDRCSILVPSHDYDRTVSLIRNLIQE